MQAVGGTNAAGEAGEAEAGGVSSGKGGEPDSAGGASTEPAAGADNLGVGGAGGESADGAGGQSAGGEDGEGGASATLECSPVRAAALLAVIGTLRCAPVEECLTGDCASQLKVAAGDNWPNGDYTGGACADYVTCVAGCACELACSLECRKQYVDSGACLQAMTAVGSCRMGACPDADSQCTGP